VALQKSPLALPALRKALEIVELHSKTLGTLPLSQKGGTMQTDEEIGAQDDLSFEQVEEIGIDRRR
jgi:hypothetical protein